MVPTVPSAIYTFPPPELEPDNAIGGLLIDIDEQQRVEEALRGAHHGARDRGNRVANPNLRRGSR